MDNAAVGKSWLEKASDDLRWCKASIDGEVWHGACFSAQQAAEKALKAYLFSQGKPSKKVHDLGALLEQCIALDPAFETLREQVLPLINYYLQTRYPDIGDFMDYSEAKASQALRDAILIVKFISKKLPL